MRKNMAGKSKKQSQKSAPRNRFHRRAKLSEYKFLKVLQAFADDIPANVTAQKTRISVKTVRGLYAGFRDRLIAGAISDPYAFGGAGRFLLDGAKLGDRGRRFLAELGKSKTYASHIKLHGFRRKPGTKHTDELFECAVRAFCTLAMKGRPEDYYPKETTNAVRTFREILEWVSENMEHAELLEQQSSLMTRLDVIIEQMPRLLEQEDLLSLKTHSTPHRYPENVLFEHLRKYLLQDPL